MTPHTPDPIHTDVLVVGAGPTGLAIAITLKRAGIDCLVVEKLATAQNTSRAAVLHAHTLEALEEIGVSQRLLAAGIKVETFSLRDRDSVLARLRFDALPSRFANLLMLPQDETERLMLDVLKEHGGQVRWNCGLESITETERGLEAALATPAGRQRVHARYAVGADGMNSLVRRTAEIGFSGHSYEESFVLADVDMDWDHGRDEVMLFFSAAGMLVVAPLPGNRFRMVATLDDAPPLPGLQDMQALLDSRGPTTGRTRVTQVHWSSRFRLQHRVADRYRAGRMFLVGDAAHVHSPAGGQGMNTGLVDACLLGKMLAAVLAGERDPGYLELYETQRRPAAQKVLKLAGFLTNMATLRSPLARFLRNTMFRIIGRLPPARHKLALNLSGIARRGAASMPLGHERAGHTASRKLGVAISSN